MRWSGTRSMYEGCRQARQMPEKPLPTFADDELARMYGSWQEDLFDGPRRATYSWTSSVGVDPAGCKLVRQWTRSASAQEDCSRGWEASRRPGDSGNAEITEAKNLSAGCNAAGGDGLAAANVPDSAKRTVAGVACIALTGATTARADAPEVCVYEKTPLYRGEPVVVQTRVSDADEKLIAVPPEARPEGAKANLFSSTTLEAFSADTAIARDRFSRDAVQRWVAEPVLQVLAQ
jgi:hypothetical protein